MKFKNVTQKIRQTSPLVNEYKILLSFTINLNFKRNVATALIGK